MRSSARNLEFEAEAFEDLAWWIQQDRQKTRRILNLLREIQRDPFRGTGKPEALKGNLSGFWSRRIDRANRIVYRVEEDRIIISACRGHYN